MKRQEMQSRGWSRVAGHPGASRRLLAAGLVTLALAAGSTWAVADAQIGIGVTAMLGAPESRLVPTGGPGPDKLVPVPSEGLDIRLWSDPGAGSLVEPGDRARLYFRTNADCYVTVFSVDTEGRVRMLFPGYREDGFVRGQRVWRLPRPHAGYDLRFAGPPGLEYVYAVASYAPMYDRYPIWITEGRVLDPDDYWWDGECDVWETGWVVGDPFYRMRGFCEHLVPEPHRTETYASAYVYFQLGRRVQYPRYLCSDCHWGGWIDPYGPSCSAVQIHIGDMRCAGWFDFRVVYRPIFTYEVSRHWRPRHDVGRRWEGPDGRWVWSSADDHRRMRDQFRDARGLDGVVRHEGNGKPPAGNDGRHGWDRGRKPEPSSGSDGWTRSHLDRVARWIGKDDGSDRPGEVRRSKEERGKGKEVRPDSPGRKDTPERVEESRPAPKADRPDRSESREHSRERSDSSGRSKSPERGKSSGERGSGRTR